MNFQRSSHRERCPHVFQREESKRGKGERSMDGITRSPSPAFPLLSLPTYFFFIWILKRESSIDGEVVRERVACFVKRRSLSKPRKKPALSSFSPSQGGETSKRVCSKSVQSQPVWVSRGRRTIDPLETKVKFPRGWSFEIGPFPFRSLQLFEPCRLLNTISKRFLERRGRGSRRASQTPVDETAPSLGKLSSPLLPRKGKMDGGERTDGETREAWKKGWESHFVDVDAQITRVQSTNSFEPSERRGEGSCDPLTCRYRHAGPRFEISRGDWFRAGQRSNFSETQTASGIRFSFFFFFEDRFDSK